MNYKVTIQGKTYELPARTLSVDDKIESVAKIDQEYRSGEITRREAVQRSICSFWISLPALCPAWKR